MPEVRRSSSRASGRGEQSDALLERRTVSDLLAFDHALQPHDSKDWTHPHCCFHATIHGLTELSIFNNITMLLTTVTEWLTTAPEPETEGIIERWAIQRQGASTHTGIFKAQRPSQIRKQWRDHCQAMVHRKVLYILVMRLCSSQSRTYTTARLPCTKGISHIISHGAGIECPETTLDG